MSRKARLITAILLWIGLVLCIGLTVVTYKTAGKFSQRHQILNTYFALKDSVEALKSIAADSLFQLSENESHKGLLMGWNQAAIWLEEIKTKGKERNIEIDYTIDTLTPIMPENTDIMQFPIVMRLKPFDGKFSTGLSFIKMLCSDTVHLVSLHSVECIGESRGIGEFNVHIVGWIHL
jgi:hypothetical protein